MPAPSRKERQLPESTQYHGIKEAQTVNQQVRALLLLGDRHFQKLHRGHDISVWRESDLA